ncbi:hypothetical protein [Escherichia coli]|uniref:hypothetical protein n=1 Tax=Escherichia coli TaxID=562 RepID=UPI00204256BE|nr:hypothetical protein [Escherichia coli]
MLKRRDAFLKKSALAVSVALLLSSQALAHKTLSEPLTGTIWLDNGTQSLESASVIDRNGNANGDTNVTGKNFAVGSGAIIWDAGKSMWICPYISRHLLSLNPLLACCRRYSRGER